MVKVAKKTIDARIAAIGNGEQGFKAEMGLASRELLMYVNETGDIDSVNRLLNVLSPANFERTKSYFMAFLPYTWEIGGRFGSKSKNKDIVSKKEKTCDEFLKNKDNNIWTWLEAKKERAPPAPRNYAKAIEDLVRRSLKDKKHAINAGEVIKAIMHAGITASDIMAVLIAPEHGEMIGPPIEEKAEQAA